MSQCSTPYGIRGLALPQSSSLLAAASGAQRLTASEVWHQRDGSGRSPPQIVLNALRHQRFGTPPTRNPFQGIHVLNALRHQRFGTLMYHIPATVVTGCSTPYGIRGLARHIERAVESTSGTCSTPYGIRGLAQRSRKPLSHLCSPDSLQGRPSFLQSLVLSLSLRPISAGSKPWLMRSLGLASTPTAQKFYQSQP